MPTSIQIIPAPPVSDAKGIRIRFYVQQPGRPVKKLKKLPYVDITFKTDRRYNEAARAWEIHDINVDDYKIVNKARLPDDAMDQLVLVAQKAAVTTAGEIEAEKRRRNPAFLNGFGSW